VGLDRDRSGLLPRPVSTGGVRVGRDPWGRQISELQQTDDWTTLPPTRALHEVNEQPEEQASSARVDQVTRHR